ncbi:MAG TPA: DUF3858 domain-containing protein [Parafilimonas sp.]|nr:DUF3858 domain-containing protein [Parafilimonas sp.]
MFFNRFTAIICGIVISVAATAQVKLDKLKFGDIKPEDFKSDYYSIDSSADAVYLDNMASARYDPGNGLTISYKVHRRIRLLHKKSFDDLATVKIPLYQHGYKEDYVQNLQAATYTYEGGKVVTTKLDKASIFKDKDGDDKIEKFTFPDLKEGCIIEYSYTKVSEFSSLPRWNFQSDYPELWTEYTVETPEYLDFVVLSKGFLTPVFDTVIKSYQAFIQGNMIEHTWAYKDVPALKEESYVTNLSNYRQSIEFQISAVRFPGRETQYFMHTWYQTVDELMKDEDFGEELSKENGWLKDDVKAVTAGRTDAVGKAKAIYESIRDNYTCIDDEAIYLSQPLKKTQQTKKGTVADINLLLIAMLKVAGLDVSPVLLSTRGNGKTIDEYPIMSKFNYVIARLQIDNTSYLLDASDPVLGFGHLGEDCYNGSARIIASDPLILNLSADSLRDAEVTSLLLINGEEGKVSGSYKSIMGQIHSADMRDKMRKSNPDDYFKELKKNFGIEAEISGATIDSLKQFDMPVSVQYNVSFKPEDDIWYFNPLIGADLYKENPFSAAERSYPVEMPYCMDKTYILSMQIPAGYQLDELPKQAKVTLNENEGSFEYLVQQAGDRIQLRTRIKLNKANFAPQDYETLRNFFAFIVQKQAEQIVFKKS